MDPKPTPEFRGKRHQGHVGGRKVGGATHELRQHRGNSVQAVLERHLGDLG